MKNTNTSFRKSEMYVVQGAKAGRGLDTIVMVVMELAIMIVVIVLGSTGFFIGDEVPSTEY